MTRVLIPISMAALMSINLLFAGEISPEREYLNNFMRVRGDAAGGVTLFHWTGKVYSMIPGEKRMELFAFEGYNIARTVPAEEGFQLLTRETAFYIDHRTGEIMENWRNPLSGKEVPVIHIWNDPVNQNLSFSEEDLRFVRMILPSTDLGDEVAFHLDIFPFYPSPLPRKEYSQFSQSDTYSAAEFFQLFASRNDLENKDLSTVPVKITWTRISPWMPFMRMGDRPGNLVFVCRGRKLPGGFADLPKHIRDFVMKKNPSFSEPPSEYSEPNETSWTYFKKLMEQGLIK
ncbi:MAG: DUF1838 family protein [Candidatus Cloacimonadaceae bacterium]|nr:DUF1838 family protein [Candidatus Cloacimonadaceae bacterium]MDP3114686.1 DUF1838 family protein [Candidatus Cloacimonadaceae bacterium]